MATESFFIHIELTEKDKDIVEKLISHLEDKSKHYHISQEEIEKVKLREEEGKKKVLEWIQIL
ncbi:MAG: hypothetical protein DSY47_07985 [Hydrogenothermus sp.]|nr:MAG: hypothetical protein DSY47_07985 [Hydrogenothermus sp.]